MPTPAVFVVSDSVGETADLVSRAAASQFRQTRLIYRRYSMIDDETAIREVLDEANGQTVIVYTMVVPELRRYLQDEATRRGLVTVDIMGPMLNALGRITDEQPVLKPGLVHELDEEYFRRVEAVEFAVKYDDGKDPRGCLKADVVLLGISRTSKTPVSLYLAQRRFKVANVPLVPEITLPRELYRVEHGRLVGLTVDPEHLHSIRQERLKTIGLRADANYASLERIMHELDYAQGVYKRLGCPVIDVTSKAVEETAVRVLEVMKKGAPPSGERGKARA